MYSSLTCAVHHSQVLTTVGSKSQQRLSNSRVATSCTLKEIVFCACAVELCAKMGQLSHLFKRHCGSCENKNKSSVIIIVDLCNNYSLQYSGTATLICIVQYWILYITISSKSQLPAGYSSLTLIPVITTHRCPCGVKTILHLPIRNRRPVEQTNHTILSSTIYKNCKSQYIDFTTVWTSCKASMMFCVWKSTDYHETRADFCILSHSSWRKNCKESLELCYFAIMMPPRSFGIFLCVLLNAKLF